MANAFGTVQSSLIVQKALDMVFAKRPLLKAISLNMADLDPATKTAVKGQQIITRLKTVPAVANFGSAATDRADADVPVTLSNFKQLYYSFTAAELNSTNRDLIAECAEPMAIALGNYFVDTIAALWIAANYPTRTGADAVANGATATKTILASGWDYTHLVGVDNTLDNAGVPNGNRFYVCNGTVYAALLTDTRIVAELNNANNAGAIMTGILPRVAGFGISKYPNLPTTGSMVGFAGTPDSTAFAVRPPKDPQEILPGAPMPMNSGYVTEPISGLTVAVDEWIGTDRSANVRISWLDGSAVGNKNNGQLICTA